MKMRALLLVRHGETAWNAEGRLQGQQDIPLSDAGRRQCRALAPYVAGLNPTHVVCSDLQRTRETALLLGYAALEYDPRLREADLGAWTGVRSTQLRAETPDQYADWRAGRATPPDAEPWADLCVRVDAALISVQRHPGITLIVTHGGPIRAACAILLGLQPRMIQSPAPASLTVIRMDGRPRLVVFNITSDGIHLAPPE